MKQQKSIGIIPARYASTRFPGKPLIDIAGKCMLQRVYEQAMASNLDQVLVATDDERIYKACKDFGAAVLMTGEHNNGTARCIEAFQQQTTTFDIMVNIQGDEPFIHPEQINAALKAFEVPNTQVATLAKQLDDLESILNTNVVKVVFSNPIQEGIYNALYFSRSPIPFVRDLPQEQWLEQGIFFKHIGLYAFSRNFLESSYPKLQEGKLEAAEKLEQLSWLENNIRIRILETSYESPNIDCPEDLQKALEWLKHRSNEFQ